jgi:HSP20 family protein
MNISDLVPWRSGVPARRHSDPTFETMRREMNELFDAFFREYGREEDEERVPSFRPAVNIAESATEYEVTVELPGMSQEDVDVKLSRDGLTVTGEKKLESEEKERNYFRRERSYGYFQRTIPLPANAVIAEKAEATFEQGILTVTLPKREQTEEKSRRIEVKAG